MKNKDEDLKLGFYQILDNEISIDGFESWLYENNEELEKILKKDSYSKLISLDYKKENSFYEVEKILLNLDLEQNLNILKAIKILNSIINKEIDIIIGVRKLYFLYQETNGKFINKQFVYYESELETVPSKDKYHLYSPDYLKTQLELIEVYREEIINDSIKLLNELKNIRNNLLNDIFK